MLNHHKHRHGLESMRKSASFRNQANFKMKKITNFLLPFAIISVLVMLVIELTIPLSHEQHLIMSRIETFVFFIYATDVVIAYTFYNSNKRFLKDKWLDILVIFPFARILKGLGHGAEILKLQSMQKAFHAAHVAGHGKEFLAVAKAETGVVEGTIKYMQNFTHLSHEGYKISRAFNV